MDNAVLKGPALERIRGIHDLSREFNALTGKPHQERLLELMRAHIPEIEELAREGDPHYLIETGDLLILCFELLLEGKADIDEVTRKCFERYENKLTGLIQRHQQTTEGPQS